MTINFKRNKKNGIWNAFDGEDFVPICEHCARIACNFRSDLLTGCDNFRKPKVKT
jgi:hypothetical protein